LGIVPELTPPTKGFKFTFMRNLQARMISFAFTYRLTDEKKYADAAKKELLALSHLNDWGLNHFLDIGEAGLAAGIGYDWLYNELSIDERKQIETAIVSNVILPSLNTQPGKGSWVNGNFNWNQVCHGGVAVAALAIADKEPELAKNIVTRALQYLPNAGEAYSPDGSYPEGPSYWSYGTSFHIFLIEALRTSLGSSYNLEKFPGFLKTADYKIQMTGPTGEEFNYSDYHLENLNEPIMLWFGRELNRTDIVQIELANIKILHDKITNKVTTLTKPTLVASRHLPLELLWWKPVSNNTENKTAHLHWTATGGLPMAAIRSEWNNPTATFVAIKGGTCDYSHAHMDVGSFILEANGVRWAVDLGTESYDKMRAAKIDLWNYTQNSSRWTTFRAGPESHNILKFDGGYQLVNGRGEVTALKTKNGVKGNESNLTSLYLSKASNVSRKVLLHPDHSVSIQDEWIAKDSTVEISFQWLTKATVIRKEYGLLLEQDGKALQIKIEYPLSINDVKIEVEDMSQAINIQDSPNPGLRRILIKQITTANNKGKLFLRAYPANN
jgi:oligo-alginate lyase